MHVPKAFQSYRSKIAEFSVEEGCLLWGRCVVILQSLHKVVLTELHKDHMGVSRMKALARSHVWWKGLNKDLEKLGRSCHHRLKFHYNCGHGLIVLGRNFMLIL